MGYEDYIFFLTLEDQTLNHLYYVIMTYT